MLMQNVFFGGGGGGGGRKQGVLWAFESSEFLAFNI